MTSCTPPCARTLRRTTGTVSSSFMMAGARWRSSIVSKSGTIGRVELSTPGVSAKRPAVLASR